MDFPVTTGRRKFAGPAAASFTRPQHPPFSLALLFANPRIRWSALAAVLVVCLYVSVFHLDTSGEGPLHRSWRATGADAQNPLIPGKEKSPISNASGTPRKNTKNLHSPVPWTEINPAYDKFAVALKSGQDVVLNRSPIQLMTYLRPIRNLILIGDGTVTVGDMTMIDVVAQVLKPKSVNSNTTVVKRRDLVDSDAPNNNATSLRRLDRRGDAVNPDESSKGWRADGHKNLPGYRELYQRFPEAEWFVMLDDDTYVFWDNLAESVSTYDPDTPYYTGAKNMFVGCDGVRQFGDGPYFAHGGSGIVMSRGALQLMMLGVDKCIERYKDCWAGDVRTALCMRDQGVVLTNMGNYNKDPPNEEFHYPGNPCQPPITFHHLLVKQIQWLFETEKKIRAKRGNGLVNFADLYADWILPTFNRTTPMETGVDRPGGDYTHFSTQTAEECYEACRNDQKCASFVFDSKQCWLKGNIPNPKPAERMVSGVFPDRYLCPTVRTGPYP